MDRIDLLVALVIIVTLSAYFASIVMFLNTVIITLISVIFVVAFYVAGGRGTVGYSMMTVGLLLFGETLYLQTGLPLIQAVFGIASISTVRGAWRKYRENRESTRRPRTPKLMKCQKCGAEFYQRKWRERCPRCDGPASKVNRASTQSIL